MGPRRIADRIVQRIRGLLLRRAAAAAWRGRVPDRVGTTARRQDMPVARHELLDTRLRRYEEEIEQLRAENEHLRSSATTFGELAERLNKSLKNAGGRGRTPIPGRG